LIHFYKSLMMFFLLLFIFGSLASHCLCKELGNTTSQLIGYKQLFTAMLDKVDDVDSQDKNGDTLLMIAARNGLTEVVNTLLVHNASVSIENVDNSTAVEEAIEYGHTALADLLKSHELGLSDPIDEISTLMTCGSYDYDYYDEDSTRAFVSTTDLDMDQVLEILLSHSSKPQRFDIEEKGWTALLTASSSWCGDVFRMLLDHGATVNIQNGQTVDAAVDVELMKEDIFAGTNQGIDENNAKDLLTLKNIKIRKNGSIDYDCPKDIGPDDLCWASVDEMGGRTSAFMVYEVSMLLACGVVDTPLRQSLCRTALIAASDYGPLQVVEILLNHDSNQDYLDVQWEDDGKTALITATQNRRGDVIKMLADHGASLDIQDNNGQTALIYAADSQFTEGVQILLTSGASVDIQDNKGQTALIRAADRGFTKVVEILVSNNASRDIQDGNGDTAFDRAKKYGKEDLIELLKL